MTTATTQSSKPGAGITPNSEDASRTPRMTRGKAIERAWPYVTATAAAMFYLFVWRFRHSLPPNFRDVLAPVVSFGASTAGFMLASASILVTVRDRDSSWYVRRAKESGVYASLLRQLVVTMAWCLTASVISMVGLAFDPRWNLAWYPYGITLWVFVISTALGVTIRVIRIFLLLLRLIASE